MENQQGSRSYTLVDVQALDHEKPLDAVKNFRFEKPDRIERCDILIVGGGMGGAAAALHTVFPQRPHSDFRPNSKGTKLKVCLTEETDWLGGQITSQGVSALDENWLVETSGATSEYQRLRSLIRRHYIKNFKLNSSVGNLQYFDPGKCWVSRLAFEPKVGLAQLEHMLEPGLEAGNLNIFLRHKTCYVTTQESSGRITVKAVGIVNLDTGATVEFQPRICIDATELGDLLPLANIPYTVGAESAGQANEDHAPDKPEPETVQDIVYPFVITRTTSGDTNLIPATEEYNEFRKKGKFSLLGYKMYETSSKIAKDGSAVELLPFWTYRRLIASDNFFDTRQSNDLTMINWEANDFGGENIIDVAPETQALRLGRAKSLSLGFLRWLQTEVQRDDGKGVGYPEFKLKKEVLDSNDGLAKYPYIRESRRIVAEKTVTEKDIGKSYNAGARARIFKDSIGIGHYPIDIHGKQEPGAAQSTKPFQIPLGALIPQNCDNLIAACKNIGVTHIANGAYRLHPIEWAIGTAAGALARLSISHGKPPCKFTREAPLQLALQKLLIESGAPLFWFDDIPTWHEHFLEIQILAITGLMPGYDDHLSFLPDGQVTRREVAQLIKAVLSKTRFAKVTVSDLAQDDPDFAALSLCAAQNLLALTDQNAIRPDAVLTIEELAMMAKNQLLRLPEHRNVFIEVISQERVDSAPHEPVTRGELALWLALLVDYKKLWHEIDLSFVRPGVTLLPELTPQVNTP